MPIPAELRRALSVVAVSGTAVLFTMATGLAAAGSAAIALRWLPAGLLVWTFVVWQCHRKLHHNHSETAAALYPSLGHGTLVTLFRGLLIAATAGFLTITGTNAFTMLTWVPAILYTAAALGDALDGHLARRQRQTTRLGAELDTTLDALGLLVAPLLAVLLGKLHFSYLLVSAAYYLFQAGQRWRQSRGRPLHPLPPSRLRRHLAGLQMAVVAASLWPPLPEHVTRPLGFVAMLPLLAGFCRDWLYVSGRLGSGREHTA